MRKLIIPFLCILFFSSCDIEVDPESSHSLLNAYSYSENFVKKRLKDPNSAEFVTSEEKLDHTKHLGNWEYEINSFVTGTNSFGGKVKTPFRCRIKFDREKEMVNVIDLKLE
jgi:hypothetical protein